MSQRASTDSTTMAGTGVEGTVSGSGSSDSGVPPQLLSAVIGGQEVTLADVWKKLCVSESKQDRVLREMEELKGLFFDLQQENASLKADITKCREEAEELRRVSEEAKHEAAVARQRTEDLEQYGRRYNVRIFGLEEGEGETGQQCEEKVLKVLNEKLMLPILPQHIDAVHRLGPRERRRQPSDDDQDSDSDTEPAPARHRAVIVRFVSRKCTQDVLSNRRKLKFSGVSITEDLTRERYFLLKRARDANVDDAWSYNGKVLIKVNNKITHVKCLADIMNNQSTIPRQPRDKPGRRYKARRSQIQNMEVQNSHL